MKMVWISLRGISQANGLRRVASHRHIAILVSLSKSYSLNIGYLPIVGISDVLEKVRVIVSFLTFVIPFVLQLTVGVCVMFAQLVNHWVTTDT